MRIRESHEVRGDRVGAVRTGAARPRQASPVGAVRLLDGSRRALEIETTLRKVVGAAPAPGAG